MTQTPNTVNSHNDKVVSAHVTMAATSTRELSPSAAVYDSLCGICFTTIHPVDNPRGRINSCEHLFCSHCIKEWAKNTNVCPSCKARFTRIYTITPGTEKVEETKVRKRNYKAWEQSYYFNDESFNDSEVDGSNSEEDLLENNELIRCMICHSAANASRIIFCDRRQCTYAAHLDCLHLHERPLTFLCPSCTELRQAEQETLSSASVNDEAEQLIGADNSALDNDVCNTHTTNRESRKAQNVTGSEEVVIVNSSARNEEQRLSSTVDHHKNGVNANFAKVGAKRQSFQPESPSPLPSPNAHTTVDFSRINLPFVPTHVQQHGEQQRLCNYHPASLGYQSTNPHNQVNNYTHDSRSGNSRAAYMNTNIGSSVASITSSNNGVEEKDDLYFLAPNPHASAALNDLHLLAELRRHDAEMRQARLLTRSRQWQEAHYSSLVRVSPESHAVHRYLAPTRSTSSSSSSSLLLAPTTTSGGTLPARRKRARVQHTTTNKSSSRKASQASMDDYTELETRLLEEEVANYTDPHRRREMEDRLARQWAREVMPNLRRQYDIAHQRLQLNDHGGIVMRPPETREERESKERNLWNEAMRQAREVVQEKLNATARQLRRRQEQLVQARAVREAAALAKLARVIALHRQQEQAHEGGISDDKQINANRHHTNTSLDKTTSISSKH